MGILRFIFAASILIFHANTTFVHNHAITKLAVPSFFIISGFYVTLIVRKKYIGKNKSYWLYISNRLLRIYPLYWVVLMFMILFSLFKYITHIGGQDNALLHGLSNSVSYVDYIARNGTLIFTSNIWQAVDPGIGYLVGPQVWALQQEILFYLCAPLILRRSPKTIAIVLMCVLVVFSLYYSSLKMMMEGSLIFVFLSSAPYFFLGIISYFLSVSWGKIKITFIPFYLIAGLVLCIGIFAIDSPIAEAVYFLALTYAVPLIFVSFAHNRWDTLLGSLSYPIFVSHIFFIKLASHLVYANDPFFLPLLSFAITLPSSYLFLRVIENPINKWRQQRLR